MPRAPHRFPNAHPKKDADFAAAGLTRTPRSARAAGGFRPTRPADSAHFDRASHEELISAAPVPLRAANGVAWFPVPGWKFPWLWSGFSTRMGGVSRAYCADDAPGELNLGLTAADQRELVLRNRQLLAEAVSGSAATPLLSLRQFHSNLVIHATVAATAAATAADAQPDRARKGDGWMTDESGFLLAIQAADCIPVLVADRRRRAVAAFHAGWRGTVKRIVESGVGRMQVAFGSRPSDLVAAIGPGIGACCYAVGEEVLSAFESQFIYARELFREVYESDPVRSKYPMLFLTQRAPGHSSIGPQLHVDLIEANRRQLLAAGVSPRAIRIVGGCTQCHPELFYSHRGSRGHAGRMMGVIGIRARA